MRGQIGRPCKAELRGQSGRSKWEAEVGGQSGRLRCEAVRGRSGRPWEAEVGGHARPNREAM